MSTPISENTAKQTNVPLTTHPLIFEINTWVWLNELSQKHGRQIDLGTVPQEEWDSLAIPGIDAVWLMGVWERSLAGIEVADRDESLQRDFRQALPDYKTEDNVGSPYCIHRYRVDEHLGGPKKLSAARAELASRGLSLVLDFVPNHVALDNPWIIEHPDYFIQGTVANLSIVPQEFFDAGEYIIANGKDPYFPAWPDVAQLNPFNPALRVAAAEILEDIAGRCDAVRCDMAMLMLNDIVQRTWGESAGHRPDTEYWSDVISTVRADYPDFKFIAEAYWDMEWNLQQLGFDYCYDKRLYDRLVNENAESIRLHLLADISYQDKLMRFIENHDEPRAAAVFDTAKERAAAMICCTLPGALLLHQGQFNGRQIRLPVFLCRRPEEPVDNGLRSFYTRLLEIIKSTGLKRGKWQLCDRSGWPDNSTYLNIVAWSWEYHDNRIIIAVNYSGQKAQALVQIPWLNPGISSWKLTDLISHAVYERFHTDMIQGLYIDLLPWNYHVLDFTPLEVASYAGTA